MGGEGSMMAANNSLKTNRALKNKRKKGSFSFVAASGEKWVDHKTASPELLEEIKNKIVREQKVRRRRVLVTTIIVAGLIISGFIYVMNR